MTTNSTGGETKPLRKIRVHVEFFNPNDSTDYCDLPDGWDGMTADEREAELTEYDRTYASDRRSRYGAYIRGHMDAIAECWDGTWDNPDTRRHEFAASVWRIANSPIMSPGYVRDHTRVLGASLQRSGWDGTLIATVELVTPWPAQLTQSRDWQSGQYWNDWPTEYRDGSYAFVTPTEQDVTRTPHLLTSGTATFPIPTGRLPGPPASADDGVEQAARDTVTVLVAELNTIVQPLLDALEGAR